MSLPPAFTEASTCEKEDAVPHLEILLQPISHWKLQAYQFKSVGDVRLCERDGTGNTKKQNETHKDLEKVFERRPLFVTAVPLRVSRVVPKLEPNPHDPRVWKH